MTVGSLVRKRRVLLGLKQSELAELLGIGQASLSRIESGERYPSRRVRIALYRALDLNEVVAPAEIVEAEEMAKA